MERQITEIYEFGPFRLDPPERLLICDGHSISITPRAFDVLVILIRSNGHIVEKAHLMQEVWGNCFVEDGNLAVAVSTLRKVLGDDVGKERKYIQTVAKHGYRFVGQVHEITGPEIRSSPETPARGSGRIRPFGDVGSHGLRKSPVQPPLNGLPRRNVIVTALIAICLLLFIIKFRHFDFSHTKGAGIGGLRVAEDGKTRTTDPSMSVLLSNRAKIRLEPRSMKSPGADDLYMKGLFFWNKRTVTGLRRSIEYFEQATIKDPRNALSYAGLADAYVLLNSYGVEPSEEAYPSAKSAALKSLELDKLLPETHASLGMVLFFYEWNWREAEREFGRCNRPRP